MNKLVDRMQMAAAEFCADLYVTPLTEFKEALTQYLDDMKKNNSNMIDVAVLSAYAWITFFFYKYIEFLEGDVLEEYMEIGDILSTLSDVEQLFQKAAHIEP